MLCVLKGSYKFFTALVDELTVARHGCKSPLVVDFIRAKSYADTESTGTLEIIGLSSLDELKGQNVLVSYFSFFYFGNDSLICITVIMVIFLDC